MSEGCRSAELNRKPYLFQRYVRTSYTTPALLSNYRGRSKIYYIKRWPHGKSNPGFWDENPMSLAARRRGPFASLRVNQFTPNGVRGEPGADRTLDTLLKRQMLYH